MPRVSCHSVENRNMSYNTKATLQTLTKTKTNALQNSFTAPGPNCFALQMRVEPCFCRLFKYGRTHQGYHMLFASSHAHTIAYMC